MESKIEKVSKSERLNHYQQKIMEKKGGQIWAKDIRVNFPLDGDYAFDDFFKVVPHIGKESKVKSLTVWKRNENSYLSGLQFTYQANQTTCCKSSKQSTLIPGWLMSTRSEEKRQTGYTSQTFELDDDEYIIRIIGRKGLVMDRFGVYTSKERTFSYGGNGGGEFSVEAPQGYHLTSFGGHFSDGWDSISSFCTEVQEIPNLYDKKELCDDKNRILDLFMNKAVLRSIIQFLNTSEMAKLFRLSRSFASTRFDEIIQGIVLNRSLLSGAPRLTKYLKKMTKNAHIQGESTTVERAQAYFKISKNRIQNPHGEQKFEGYEITRNGGNGIEARKDGDLSFFITSFGWDTLQWKREFSEIFAQNEFKEIMDKIITQQYAIVLAADFCDTGFGTEGQLEYSIKNQEGDIIKSDTLAARPIPREFTTFSFKYTHPDPLETPHSITFLISGKDTCYWAGHYGAKIRNITFKLVPINT